MLHVGSPHRIWLIMPSSCWKSSKNSERSKDISDLISRLHWDAQCGVVDIFWCKK